MRIGRSAAIAIFAAAIGAGNTAAAGQGEVFSVSDDPKIMGECASTPTDAQELRLYFREQITTEQSEKIFFRGREIKARILGPGSGVTSIFRPDSYSLRLTFGKLFTCNEVAENVRRILIGK